MKIKALVTFLLSLLFSQVHSQNKGLFKNWNVKAGFTISAAIPLGEAEVYSLQTNARVVAKSKKKPVSLPLSIVILIPLSESEDFNLVFNISPLELEKAESFYNTSTPFGLGFAWFPFKKIPLKGLGFSAFCNFAYEYRMEQETIDQNFFPIANYPGFNLTVGTPIPVAIYKPLSYTVPTFTPNFGIVFRL